MPDAESWRPLPRRSAVERVQAWVVWFGPGRLAASAAAVLAVCIGGYWLVRPPEVPVEQRLPFASTTTGPAPPPTAQVVDPVVERGDTLVVHVAGAVQRPGVYRLSGGSRVVDAVTMAGGAIAGADVDALNLAAPVADGERIYVPIEGETPPPALASGSGGDGLPPAGPVDLNTATVEQLDDLPGVGPVTAQAIVAHRDRNGPFASVDALTDVRGIGPAKVDALRHLVTV
jgi:competence protein ComEA